MKNIKYFLKYKISYLFIFIFTLFSFPVFCYEITLKQKLAEAEPGSYLVTEQNKIFTFLHVNEKRDHSIVLEEVVVPAIKFMQYHLGWRDWFQSGGPGHTAWTLTQINLDTGKLEEMFSFPHQGWIDVSQADSFMSTLLNLCFKEVPLGERRRIGLPPGYGKPDYRPLWNPRLIVEGMQYLDVPFTAWKTRWPSDRSELSRKIIEIYLPEIIRNPQMPDYPAYFPFWLEVEGKIGSAKIRVVDSGTGVVSPKSHLPYRPPELIGNGVLQEDGLALEIKSPSYFHEFVVIAEEVDSLLGKTVVLPCQVLEQDANLTLFVTKSELEKFLTPGEHYRFSILPKEDMSICIETLTPITYQ